MVECRTVDEVADAIRTMRVRGAPAIGATAAYGMALAAPDVSAATIPARCCGTSKRPADQLKATRPTAVNLAWAVDRMIDVAARSDGQARDVSRRARRSGQGGDAGCRRAGIADEDVAANRQHGRSTARR